MEEQESSQVNKKVARHTLILKAPVQVDVKSEEPEIPIFTWIDKGYIQMLHIQNPVLNPELAF